MTVESNRYAGRRGDFHPHDYMTPRVRSDREWVELEKSPPMESTASQAVGVLLVGLSAIAILILIANIVRVFW